MITNILCLFLSGLIKIYLILSGAPLLIFVYAVLLDSIFVATGLIYFYFRHGLSLIKWRFNKLLAKELLKEGFPLILSSMVVVVYMKIDQLMIRQILDVGAVGQYAAALRLSEFWYFIPTIVSASVFPAIINGKRISRDLLWSVSALFNILFWFSLFIAVAVVLCNDLIIDTLFGSQYFEAKPILVVHIFTGVFAALGISSSYWFIEENLQKFLFYRALSGAIVNIILNIILIEKHGALGAAYASLAAQFLSSYFFNITSKNTLPMFLIQSKVILAPFYFFARKGKFI